MAQPVLVTKPEETENFIHYPVRDSASFVQDSFRTITLSESKGIKAVIGKLKSDPNGPTHTQQYLFDKDKGWTMEKAEAWVKEHKEDVLGSSLSEDSPLPADTANPTNRSDRSQEGHMENQKFYASRVSREFRRKYITTDVIRSIGQTDAGEVFRGAFTSDNQDEVGDVITREATQKAVQKYRQWGNIRYMHQPRAVGKVVGIGDTEDLSWNEVKFLITHDDVAKDIKAGVLSGMSVGIIVNEYEELEGGAKGKDKFFFGPMKITDYDLVEISVVDHPANYDAAIQSGKSIAEAGPQVRKVLFERDPESQFELVLSATQLDKKLEVAVFGEIGKRKALVRQKRTGRTELIDEVDGSTGSDLTLSNDQWEVVKEQEGGDSLPEDILSAMETATEAAVEETKEAPVLEDKDVVDAGSEPASPVSEQTVTAEVVSDTAAEPQSDVERAEPAPRSEYEMLLTGFTEMSSTVKASMGELAAAIQALVGSLTPPKDAALEPSAPEPGETAVEEVEDAEVVPTGEPAVSLSNEAEVTAPESRVIVTLESGENADLVKMIESAGSLIGDLAKSLQAEVKARTALAESVTKMQASVEALSKSMVTKDEFEAAKRPRERKSVVDGAEPEAREAILSQDEIARMKPEDAQAYFRKEFKRLVPAG